jgi:hypothetical protein
MHGEERNTKFSKKIVKGRDRMGDLHKEEENMKVDRHDV